MGETLGILDATVEARARLPELLAAEEGELVRVYPQTDIFSASQLILAVAAGHPAENPQLARWLRAYAAAEQLPDGPQRNALEAKGNEAAGLATLQRYRLQLRYLGKLGREELPSLDLPEGLRGSTLHRLLAMALRLDPLERPTLEAFCRAAEEQQKQPEPPAKRPRAAEEANTGQH